jgi:hypothetical protein
VFHTDLHALLYGPKLHSLIAGDSFKTSFLGKHPGLHMRFDHEARARPPHDFCRSKPCLLVEHLVGSTSCNFIGVFGNVFSMTGQDYEPMRVIAAGAPALAWLSQGLSVVA